MLGANLLEKRVYPAGIIQGAVIFEEQFGSMPNSEVFAHFTADKTLGAVEPGLCLFSVLIITYDCEKNPGQAQVVGKLNSGDSHKTYSRIIKTTRKNRAYNFMNGLGDLVGTFVHKNLF